MRLVHLMTIQLVHVVANNDRIFEQPAFFEYVRLVLWSERTKPALVSTGILIPGLFRRVEIHHVWPKLRVGSVLDKGESVGENPEAALFTAILLFYDLLAKSPPAEQRVAASGDGYTAHPDHVLVVPAGPVVEGVDFATRLEDTVGLAMDIHLVERIPDGQLGVAKLFDTLSEFLVSGLWTSVKTLSVRHAEDGQQRSRDEDTGTAKAHVSPRFDLPGCLGKRANVMLLRSVEGRQFLPNAAERDEEGVVVNEADPGRVGTIHLDVFGERFDEAKVTVGKIERRRFEGDIQTSLAEVLFMFRHIVGISGDEDEE